MKALARLGLPIVLGVILLGSDAGAGVALSRAGRPCGRILFESNWNESSALKSASGSGGDIRKVANGEHFSYAVSPDGRLIAYEVYSAAEDDVDIWIVGTDGTDARSVTDTALEDEREVDWSPDSASIAFSSSDGSGTVVKVLDVTTGEKRVVTEGHSPNFSPNGAELAFVSSSAALGDLTTDIFSIDLQTGTLTPLTNDPSSHDESPKWSPNGRWIAFDRYPLGQMNENEGPYADLWKVRLDASREKQLTEIQSDYVGVSWATWSPDARFIAFNTEQDSGGAVEIIHADGREKTGAITNSLNHPSRRPSWSPRGTSIAFERYGAATTEIWRYDLSSRAKKNLTGTKKRYETHPAWVSCRG